MPHTQGQEEDGDGLAPWSSVRPRFLVLPVVAILHLLLALLLVLGLRLPGLLPAAPAIQVMLETQRPRPPEPPRMPRLAKPEKLDASAPEIDIALAPPAITSAPQGAMVVAAGGGGNDGSGGNGAGQGTRFKLLAPVAPLDPNCETIDAYTARVRSAIARYFDYSAQAKDAHIQGEVMIHFLSDPRGRITDSAVTASNVERLYPGYMDNGHYENFIVAFRRGAADSWAWQARAHSDTGMDVALGSGTATAGPDGILRAQGRDDGKVVLAAPETLPNAVPRITLVLGPVSDLVLLEKSVRRTLDLAQPLPSIPACLKLANLNAMMPFRFHQDDRRYTR